MRTTTPEQRESLANDLCIVAANLAAIVPAADGDIGKTIFRFKPGCSPLEDGYVARKVASVTRAPGMTKRQFLRRIVAAFKREQASLARLSRP